MIEAPADAEPLSPEEEEVFSRLLVLWREALRNMKLSYGAQAAVSAMMLVAMQSHEEHAGSEHLADTLEGLAAAIRNKHPESYLRPAPH